MSSLIVKVREIEEVLVHPSADRLEICVLAGWKVISQKGLRKKGDKVVYFPPDSELSQEWVDKMEIIKYVSPVKKLDSTRYRIRAIRLRGESSFGHIHTPDQEWELGTDVSEFYGVTKWEPPLSCVDGDAASPIPAFHKYTGIENWQNFPDIFVDGEEIVVSEKVHGKCCAVAKIRSADETGNETFEYMARSHEIRRKPVDSLGRPSDFWLPLTTLPCANNVRKLLDIFCGNKDNVILFGELFGNQDMRYGLPNATQDFRAFDISMNGKYLDFDEFEITCRLYGVQIVPILYRGPYSREKIFELTDGPTIVCSVDKIQEPFRGREGIVFKPTKERFNFDLGGDGRVILKSVSADYHGRKNKNQSEDH